MTSQAVVIGASSAAPRAQRVRSVEAELKALVQSAFVDAFANAAVRDVVTFFATPALDPGVAERVMNRIGPRVLARPSSEPLDSVIARAIDTAAQQESGAVLLVLESAVLVLQSHACVVSSGTRPYAILESSAPDDALPLEDLPAAVRAVAFGALPSMKPPSMKPWFSDGDRVARVGTIAVRQWQREVINRFDAPPTQAILPPKQELFLFAADSREELLENIQRRAGITGHRYRLAVLGEDKLPKAVQALSTNTPIRSGRDGIWFTDNAPPTPRRLAFLFPGQGSQYPGMLADLVCHFPSVRNWYERLDANETITRPSRWFFPINESREDVDRWIMDPEIGGNGGFVASMALDELLAAMGLQSDALVGYSNGENATLILSGAIHVDNRDHLFSLMQEVRGHARAAESGGRLPKGTTLAVTGVSRERVEEVIAPFEGRVFISIDNCPSQVIVFGGIAEIEEVIATLNADGAVCLRLPFERAYHTPIFATRSHHIRMFYGEIDFRTPKKRIWSCATAAPFPDDPDAVRDIAALQWHSRVRFRETIEHLYDEGIRDFIEVGGAGRVTGYVRDILRGKEHSALAADIEGRSTVLHLQTIAAHAFVAGWNVDASIFRPRGRDGVKMRHVRDKVSTIKEERRRVVVAPPRPAPPRPKIAGAPLLEAHFALMNEFLESQTRAFAMLTGSAQPAELPPVDPNWPFLGRIVQRDEQRIESIRTLSPALDGALRDHALGRPVAGDTPALGVLPLSIAMEMMAEAAAALFGGSHVVTGFRDVRGYRWVAADHGVAHVRMTGVRRSETEVEVTLYEVPDDSGTHQGERAFEAVIELRRDYEQGTPAIRSRAGAARPRPLYDATEYYNHCLFHGSLFHLIRELRAVDADGIEAQLSVPAEDDLITGVAQPHLQVPALLLDAGGQLMAYWLVECGKEFFGEFPFRIGAVSLHRRVTPGELLVCRGSTRHDGTTSIGSFELLGDDDSLAVSITDFTSRHYVFDRDFLGSLYWPGSQTFTSKDLDLGHRGDTIVRVIDQLTPEFLTSSHAIWSRALAHMTLRDDERRHWYTLPAHGLRRIEWLLGRVAAKDAVRVWASMHEGIELDPRDIGIATDELGAPVVVCDKLTVRPAISISHTNGRAVAAASRHAVGIDHELPRDIPDEAFSDEERARWSGGSLLPLWCAREAASKASGKALQGAWLQWRVAAAAPERVVIEHEGTRYDVHLASESDHIFALCAQEETP